MDEAVRVGRRVLGDAPFVVMRRVEVESFAACPDVELTFVGDPRDCVMPCPTELRIVTSTTFAGRRRRSATPARRSRGSDPSLSPVEGHVRQ